MKITNAAIQSNEKRGKCHSGDWEYAGKTGGKWRACKESRLFHKAVLGRIFNRFADNLDYPQTEFR